MMEEVMRHVIADVPKNTATVYHHSRMPIIRKDGMGKLVEWRSKDKE